MTDTQTSKLYLKAINIVQVDENLKCTSSNKVLPVYYGSSASESLKQIFHTLVRL